MPFSPAAVSKRTISDQVISIQGQPVKSTADLKQTLLANPPGQPVRFVINRGGSDRSVMLTLSSLQDKAAAQHRADADRKASDAETK